MLATLPTRLPRGLRRLIEGQVRPRYPYLLESFKTQAIDVGFASHGVRSFADLGGVWRVDGGYTLYGLENHAIDRAFIVDLEFSPGARERAQKHPQLTLVESRFTDPPVLERVGDLDAVLLFDVLLHQAAPDWDEVLEFWAPNVRCFVIANPQWVGDRTIRLYDLGEDEFLRNVPADVRQHGLHHEVFEDGDRSDVYGKRLWDSTAIWQWGITDEDLTAKLGELGFELTWREDYGRWADLERFQNRAFVFARP